MDGVLSDQHPRLPISSTAARACGQHTDTVHGQPGISGHQQRQQSMSERHCYQQSPVSSVIDLMSDEEDDQQAATLIIDADLGPSRRALPEVVSAGPASPQQSLSAPAGAAAVDRSHLQASTCSHPSPRAGASLPTPTPLGSPCSRPKTSILQTFANGPCSQRLQSGLHAGSSHHGAGNTVDRPVEHIVAVQPHRQELATTAMSAHDSQHDAGSGRPAAGRLNAMCTAVEPVSPDALGSQEASAHRMPEGSSKSSSILLSQLRAQALARHTAACTPYCPTSSKCIEGSRQ